MESRPGIFEQTPRMMGALAAVAAVTWVVAKSIPVDRATAGFAYIITILLIATAWGLRESVVASLAATLCYDYYVIPPSDSFQISRLRDVIALLAFIAAALIASQLSERARNHTREALRREGEMERLYDLSRSILMTSPSQPFAAQIAQEIRRIYEFPAVAVYDLAGRTLHSSGQLDAPELTRRLEETAAGGKPFHDSKTSITVTPISLGHRPAGALALQGRPLSHSALQALSNLVGVGLERVRAEETANRAEAARQSEEFKSILLDALAHEFKTPLTSLKAAASAILSNGVTEAGDQRELLAVIHQDADRLSTLVTEATQLARVEAGMIQLRCDLYSVRELIQRVLRQMEVSLEGRTVRLAIPENLPPISVDAELVQLVLKQLLDNAVKYSPSDSPIQILASANDEGVSIRVRNEGAAIPEDERSKIFERFYRGESVSHHTAGSGMGLAIAREIIQAHGGDLRVECSTGTGVEFIASLPLQVTTVAGGNEL